MNFIYITTNLVNGKQYIGSHNGEENDEYLGSGKLFSFKLNEYGKENFKREIIEECDPSLNLVLETKYIEEYNTLIPNGYNISRTGGLGLVGEPWGNHTTKTKNRISEKLTGRKLSDKTKKKISIANKGKKRSEEAKEKYSKAKKGKKLSEDHKRKISESEKGRIFSEDHKRKISISNKGKNNPMYGKIPWNKGGKLNKK